MIANTSQARTQRKLERLELKHLRQLTAELHEQLEQARADAEYAWDCANAQQGHAMMLQESLADTDFATHRTIGLTKTGETIVVALQ